MGAFDGLKRCAALALVSVLILALAACAPTETIDQPPSPSAPVIEVPTIDQVEHAQWRAEALDWRERRYARLIEPFGWLSLVALEPLKAGRWSVGSDKENHFNVSSGPVHWGDLVVLEDRVWFDPAAVSGMHLDGEPIDSGFDGEIELYAITDGEPTAIEAGTVQIHLLPRAGQPVLRIRDHQSPTRTEFAGLDYFEFDPDWRITARWVPNAPGQTLLVANVLGELVNEPNPGMAEFEVNGQTAGLQAVLNSDGDQLFFILADRTSGRETYGLGRFLYSDLPKNGKVVLDFNRSYNPPCAFTAYSTCPLPPPENRLDLRIEAGELAYQ